MASSKLVRNLKVLILISHGHTSSRPTRLKNPAYVICKQKTPEMKQEQLLQTVQN